jgi:hypothetical protein
LPATPTVKVLRLQTREQEKTVQKPNDDGRKLFGLRDLFRPTMTFSMWIVLVLVIAYLVAQLH